MMPASHTALDARSRGGPPSTRGVEQARATLLAENRRLTRELAAALDLDELVVGATTLDELSRSLIDRVCTLTPARRCGLMLFEGDREMLRLLPGSYGGDDDGVASAQFRPAGEPTIAGLVFNSREPYVSEAPELDPHTSHPEYVSLFGLTRMLSVPLRAQDRMIGVLHLADKPFRYTREDVRRAQRVASWVATVLEVGGPLVEFRRAQKLERILSDFALDVASGRTIRESLFRVLGGLSNEIRSDYTVLRFHTSCEPIVREAAAAGLDPDERRAVWRQADESAPAGARVADPVRAGDPGESLLRQPLLLGSVPVATLCAYRGSAESFLEIERHAVARFASIAALAFQAERHRKQRAALARVVERQRVADELHDHAAQLLFVAQLELEGALDGVPHGEVATARALNKARDLVGRSDRAIRDAVQPLPPPESRGLGDRLGQLVQELEDEFDVPIRLDVSRYTERGGSPGTAVTRAVLRVAHEGVVNAVKHGDPSVVAVTLARQGGDVTLTVRDDGIGIPGTKACTRRGRAIGYGLTSLQRSVQDWGGSLRVFRRPGGGTELQATLAI